MPVTRFPARASGPAERIAGFLAHLRLNGFRLGAGETAEALGALAEIRATDPGETRAALRALLCGSGEEWESFDALFDAYWFNAGRARPGAAPAPRTTPSRPRIWDARLAPEDGQGAGPEAGTVPDDGDGPAEGTDGRLVATARESVTRRDLRELVSEEEMREAARIAERLARAIRERRSRRARAAPRGRSVDLRATIRRSLPKGGEPIDLRRRRRPDRPLRVVALLDVSGSMAPYARVFLAFLKGLVGAETGAEAFLFHTRLMRVTQALAEPDPLAAAGRLSLMAEGFGGGTRIGEALGAFNDAHARHALRGRALVLVLSDGYDCAPPERLGAELARLRRRARRVVWLNPLKGWRDYAPVAAGMAAALPHLDAFLPANTLESLAALEAEFAAI
jgi:uncharacterized protein with von Willebrand factor type A (vWA) domain